MQFKIFQSTGADGAAWADLISRLKPEDRDVHFLPEYANIYKQTYGYEPILAFYGDTSRFIIQVLVKRRLNELPFLKDQNITEPFYDIANPYGYGGPVCQSDSVKQSKALFREFNSYLIDYCYQNKIASEFCCFHPLLNNHHLVEDSGLIEVNYEKEVVYFDLTLNEAELWRGMNHGSKSRIKQAKQKGVTIQKVPLSRENFNVFNELYYQTMVRNNAKARWFVPENYFWNYVVNLGDPGVSLFFARVNEQPIAAVLLMHAFSTVYHHFSGSDRRFFSFGPNNLLMYEMVLWAKKHGYLKFHLGGGVSSSPEDELFKFKSGFSKDHRSLYSYHRIHHHEVYEKLSVLKRKHEKMTGQESNSDYFPIYRR